MRFRLQNSGARLVCIWGVLETPRGYAVVRSGGVAFSWYKMGSQQGSGFLVQIIEAHELQ